MACQMYSKKERRLFSVEETIQRLKEAAKNPAHRKTSRYLLDQISTQLANKTSK